MSRTSQTLHRMSTRHPLASTAHPVPGLRPSSLKTQTLLTMPTFMPLTRVRRHTWQNPIAMILTPMRSACRSEITTCSVSCRPQAHIIRAVYPGCKSTGPRSPRSETLAYKEVPIA